MDAIFPEIVPANTPSKPALRRWLDNLPPDDRRLVLLRYADQLDENEIALALDLPPLTVRCRLAILFDDAREAISLAASHAA